jgi:hypothetical protein
MNNTECSASMQVWCDKLPAPHLACHPKDDPKCSQGFHLSEGRGAVHGVLPVRPNEKSKIQAI